MMDIKHPSLGFSTCPNDTFIFDAWVNRRLRDDAFVPEVRLADVEELNQLSATGQLDITKLSVGNMSAVSNQYQILDAGSALGFGCGPLLISRELISANPEHINSLKIAIPGKNTTANLLLSMAFPEAKNKVVMLFSDIEEAVIKGDVDAGLIIHENRFTYADKGLKKIIDLGEFWENKTGLPIPLGCIAVKRSLPMQQKASINTYIRESVEFAFEHPDASLDYMKAHAQEMEPSVMRQHISLYVNDYSLSLGEKGKMAIRRLLQEGIQAGIIQVPMEPLFADDSQ